MTEDGYWEIVGRQRCELDTGKVLDAVAEGLGGGFGSPQEITSRWCHRMQAYLNTHHRKSDGERVPQVGAKVGPQREDGIRV